MSDGSSRLLTLKASRAQVAAKLAEWDAAYVREHGAEPTDAQRRHDARWRELHRLLADLDKHIFGVEGGGAKPELSSPAEERRSERGRIKARMRRWDRDFERLRGRKPTSADRRADAEFAELRERLSALSSGSSSTAPAPPGGAESTAAATGAQVEAVGWATLAGPSREASPLPVLPPSSPPPIAKGGHYNERVLANLHSKGVLDGFRATEPGELAAATAMFAQLDMDRDGVIGFEEFYLAMSSLAQRAGKPLDAARAERLFALADIDANRVLDLNEFLWMRRELARRGHAPSQPAAAGQSRAETADSDAYAA